MLTTNKRIKCRSRSQSSFYETLIEKLPS